jgi:hypothetical protein
MRDLIHVNRAPTGRDPRCRGQWRAFDPGQGGGIGRSANYASKSTSLPETTMKALLHRNPLRASLAVVVFFALAATGYALAFDHAPQAVAPQPHATMLVPF